MIEDYVDMWFRRGFQLRGSDLWDDIIQSWLNEVLNLVIPILLCYLNIFKVNIMMNFAARTIPRTFGPNGRCVKPRGFLCSSGLHFSTSHTLRAVSSLERESAKGRNVIVTGSSRGIGKSIALRLAADGYNVCINDIGANSKGCEEVVKEIKAMGRNSCSAIADVSKRDEVAQMVQISVKELGPLDVM
jgi:hypothetical protein